MSFQTIRTALKQAHKHAETYTVVFNEEDFMDLADIIDELESRRKSELHRISAKTLLRMLPGVA